MKRLLPLLLLLPAPAAAAPSLRVHDHLDWKGAGFPPDVRVWCGPWSADASNPSIHVLAGTRARHWQVDAVLADVQARPTIRFPHSFVFDHPRGAEVFAATPLHEVSSATDTARGKITFTRVSCKNGLRLAFHIDATLGSELSDGRPLRVTGTFSASVAPG